MCLDILNRLSVAYESEGQTDRQTDRRTYKTGVIVSIVLIDVLIYSAARVFDKLTYLLTYFTTRAKKHEYNSYMHVQTNKFSLNQNIYSQFAKNGPDLVVY